MSSSRISILVMSTLKSFFSSASGGKGGGNKRDRGEDEEEPKGGKGEAEDEDDAEEPSSTGSDGSGDEFDDERDVKPGTPNKRRKGKKDARKNSPRNTDTPDTWPKAVWQKFKEKLDENRHRSGTYYTVVQSFPDLATDANAPPPLRNEQCHVPTKSNMMMVAVNSKEYQRPLHRIRLYLRLREQGVAIPKSENQASHICPDAVNTSGRGSKHCNNPDHMVIEDDKTNKARQRCAGWIWIHPYQVNLGGYWYPTCSHSPPCLRYTAKTKVPTIVALDQTQQSASSSGVSSSV